MGGSLSGKCDLLEQHADSLLRPYLSMYHEILIIDKRPGHVVATNQISKGTDKRVVRKLWVVL